MKQNKTQQTIRKECHILSVQWKDLCNYTIVRTTVDSCIQTLFEYLLHSFKLNIECSVSLGNLYIAIIKPYILISSKFYVHALQIWRFTANQYFNVFSLQKTWPGKNHQFPTSPMSSMVCARSSSSINWLVFKLPQLLEEDVEDPRKTE